MQTYRWPALIAVVALAAAAGAVVGAAIYATVFADSSPARGEVLNMAPGDRYHDIENMPFCVTLQHFCLVRLDGGEIRALYTYDTHAWFRAQSCEIVWLAEMDFTDPDTGETTRGWFRGNCSGSTFRYSGERVFGPAPRNMDEFAVEEKVRVEVGPAGEPIEVRYLEVDTRHLLCGDRLPGVPHGCEWAPLPQ